jgi:hypothetical protein
VSLLLSHGNDGQEVEMIDQGGHRKSKLRRLTNAQEAWATRKTLGKDFKDFDFSLRLAERLAGATHTLSASGNCDCSSPWKMSGSKRVCRCFGTFQRAWGNQWTRGLAPTLGRERCKPVKVAIKRAAL